MANKKNTIGVGLAVDGEKKFKEAIDGVAKEMSVLKSEMNKVGAEFKDNANSMEANRAKSVVLQKQIEQQKSKIDILNNALKEATRKYGANSDEVKNWQIKLNNSEAELSKLNTKLKESGSVSDVATKGFSKLKTGIVAIGAALTAAVGTMVKQGVEYDATMQQYETSFETMTGSAEKAKRITTELKNIANATPFELTDLAETTQLLMNYDMTADEATKKMQMLGDISQGNADKLNRVATAYGQMSSAGKVQLEDVKQMIEAGFNPLVEISKTTGESMTSLYSRISKGTISVDEITESMERSTAAGGKYFGAMEKQSKTLNGEISTLKDTIDSKLGEAMDSSSNKLTSEVIPNITKMINSIDVRKVSNDIAKLLEDVVNFGSFIARNKNTIITTIEAVGAGFLTWKIGPMISGIVTSISAMKTAMLTAEFSVKGLGTALKTQLGPISLVVAALTVLTSAYINTKNEIEDTEKKAIDKKYNKLIDGTDKYYNKLIDSETKEKDALEKGLSLKEKSINAYYDAQEKAISKNLKAIQKALKQENEAYSEAHEKRLKEIEEEQKQRYADIDAVTNEETAKVQAKINAIDAQTSAEEQAKKEKENNDKIAELQQKINAAATSAEKVQAQKELNTLLAQIDQEKVLAEREAQKQALQNQIENIKAEADTKKAAVDVDIQNQKAAADATLKVQQQSVSDRLDALDGYTENEKAKLETSRTNALTIEQGKTADLTAEIDKRITKYEEQETAARDALAAEQEEAESDAKAGAWDVFKNWLNKFADSYFDGSIKGSNGKSLPRMGWNASGTDDWRGGLTHINEKGGEIVNLPTHTQIIPHDVSMELARAYARQSASKSVTINNYNTFQSTSNRDSSRFMNDINRQLGRAYGG